MQTELKPGLAGVVPGFVDDEKRLYDIPPDGEEFKRIHELTVPSEEEATAILLSLLDPDGHGATYWDVMRVLGACSNCARLNSLSIFGHGHHQCKPEDVL